MEEHAQAVSEPAETSAQQNNGALQTVPQGAPSNPTKKESADSEGKYRKLKVRFDSLKQVSSQIGGHPKLPKKGSQPSRRIGEAPFAGGMPAATLPESPATQGSLSEFLTNLCLFKGIPHFDAELGRGLSALAGDERREKVSNYPINWGPRGVAGVTHAESATEFCLQP